MTVSYTHLSEDPPIKRKEFCMNPKYQKVLSDIERAEQKKSEIDRKRVV